MKRTEPQGPLDQTAPSNRSLRRIIVTAALVVLGLILILAAIYVGVFVILAPMMQ
jgi:hypothetical protein